MEHEKDNDKVNEVENEKMEVEENDKHGEHKVSLLKYCNFLFDSQNFKLITASSSCRMILEKKMKNIMTN